MHSIAKSQFAEENEKYGTLYVVATPIGNLEDVTLRAVKILSEVDVIYAEDTRVTKKLLNYLKTDNRKLITENRSPTADVRTYHQHSLDKVKLEILNELLNGKNIALVTDAGTPGISDPGNELVEFIRSQSLEVRIVPIPGPAAVTAALSICGFRADKFLFLGFWPKKKVNKLIELIKLTKLTTVFYESPHRILKTLDLIRTTFGDETRVFIGRELTKLHETTYRGTVKEVIGQLKNGKIKGEIVVVVELG